MSNKEETYEVLALEYARLDIGYLGSQKPQCRNEAAAGELG